MSKNNHPQRAGADNGWTKSEGFDPTHKFEKVGDMLTGTLVACGTAVIEGDARTKYTFEVDGARCTVWGNSVLDARLPELVGREVRLTYKGPTPSQKNPKRTYNDFTVEYR